MVFSDLFDSFLYFLVTIILLLLNSKIDSFGNGSQDNYHINF